MIRGCLILLALVAMAAAQGRMLIRPDPTACQNRVDKASTFRNGHHYFFSWSHPPTANKKRDWLDGRNICRMHCQDLVSLESEDEARFINSEIEKANVKDIWTSGRKCNFDGCDRPDFQPLLINGWFWSGSEDRLPATNSSQGWRGDWSHTGGRIQPQPDNRAFLENDIDESCIAILNNFYNDGVKWHDVDCFKRKPWVCEDSDELLNFARASNPNIRIP